MHCNVYSIAVSCIHLFVHDNYHALSGPRKSRLPCLPLLGLFEAIAMEQGGQKPHCGSTSSPIGSHCWSGHWYWLGQLSVRPWGKISPGHLTLIAEFLFNINTLISSFQIGFRLGLPEVLTVRIDGVLRIWWQQSAGQRWKKTTEQLQRSWRRSSKIFPLTPQTPWRIGGIIEELCSILNL